MVVCDNDYQVEMVEKARQWDRERGERERGGERGKEREGREREGDMEAMAIVMEEGR